MLFSLLAFAVDVRGRVRRYANSGLPRRHRNDSRAGYCSAVTGITLGCERRAKNWDRFPAFLIPKHQNRTGGISAGLTRIGATPDTGVT